MKNFEALGLSQPVLKALHEMGFEDPTEIQSQTIPFLLSQPQDLIGLAQTGTGKTAAFGLPLVELIDPDERRTQALVLAPTRELAQQITGQLESFQKYLSGAKVVCVYGGASITAQISELKRGAQIVVATPGRLIDLTKRKVIDLRTLDYVVLDEADEMLNMGFKDDLDYILAQAPETKITWLFSATMPAEIKRMVNNYMQDPVEIRINSGQKVNINIEHQFAVLKASDKTEALRRLMDFDPAMYGVVFCRTKRDCQKVAEELVESGYAAEPLHGDLSQSQRDAVMKRFRAKNLQLLIATDVAARGIDVDNLTHVIHFALPDDPEYYTHRSGRTARAGRKGISLALITKGEFRRVRFLENKLGIQFGKALIPAIGDIARNRVVHWATRLAEQQTTEVLNDTILRTAEEILSSFSREELIAKWVGMHLERISKQSSIPDLNDTSRINAGEEGSGREERRGRTSRDRLEEGMQRYFINIGSVDQMNKGGLLRYICDNSGLTSADIGRIDLGRKHSYFDVQEKMAGKVNALSGLELGGRDIRVNRDNGPALGGSKKKKDKKKHKAGKGRQKRR